MRRPDLPYVLRVSAVRMHPLGRRRTTTAAKRRASGHVGVKSHSLSIPRAKTQISSALRRTDARGGALDRAVQPAQGESTAKYD